MKFTLGSDPELMLKNKETGKLVSAIPIIKEGKGEGRPLDEEGLNSVIHDNTMVEFNTKPAQSMKEFVDTIGFVLKRVNGLVNEQGLELHLQSSAEYPEEELQDEEARKFGCEPDFNAWLLAINDVAADAAEKPFRSAGGHLHIGTAKGEDKLNAILEDDYGKVDVVKALDVFPGIISIFLDKDETAAARRALYGGAGAHRPKPYGVEYRALGNWWLASPAHTEIVYKLTEVALEVLLSGKLPKLLEQIKEKTIQRVINKSDAAAARKIYQKYLMPHLDEELIEEIAELDDSAPANFLTAWGM